MKKIKWISFALMLLTGMPFSSFGQVRFTKKTSYSILNAPPAQAVYKNNLSATSNSISVSGEVTVSPIYKGRIRAVDLIAANENIVCFYGIPFRVMKDMQVLISQLEKKILAVQNQKNAMMNFYNSQSDNGKRSMEANGLWNLISRWDSEISKYQQMIDDVQYNSAGKLNFKVYAPASVKADFRFIDPITAVPLMKASKNEDVAGGYLALMDFIPFEKLENLPVKKTITIFRK